jgi:A/G-specific adenine glycosylase
MANLSSLALKWYQRKGRQLPWRGIPSPYATLVSEIMLQQTRVDTVIPYFERWMGKYPTVAALASASEQEVLSLWEGLGYYSRARNLHHAAQLIVKDHQGEIPDDVDTLGKLPGIGRYTAGAIASMAFGKDVPALDANIRRVLARAFNVDEPVESRAGKERLWQLAQSHLPRGRAGDFNQALMDLGAMICLPKNPLCADCPLADLCQAKALGLQEQRPVLKKKGPIPHYQVVAAVISRDGKYLLARRPSKGLLGGMWEFPGGKVEAGEKNEAGLRREIQEELGVDVEVGQCIGSYKHAYTHYRISLSAFSCTITSKAEPRALEAAEIRWVEPSELGSYPMGKVDRLISRQVIEENGPERRK